MRPGAKTWRRTLSFLAGLAVVFAAGCSPATPQFRSMDVSAVTWGGDFTLTAHNGRRMRLSELKDRVVVLFFGYTYCPDICAPTLARLAAVLRRLGPDAGRVQVVFVSVDSERDNPGKLAGFVTKFHPSFLGMTGSAEEIAAVAADYKVAYAPNPGSPANQTLLDHTSSLMIKDAKGKLRLLVKNDAPVEDIEHDLRLLLKEKRVLSAPEPPAPSR